MSHLYATAGTKVSIGGPLAFNGTDFDASDFAGQSWVEIGGTKNLGSSGDTSQLITSDQVNAGRTRKLKGTRNAGSMTLVCDLDSADAGQIALLAAERVKESYAFKIEFNDAPVGGTPSIRYFVALVMAATEELNEASSVMQLNTTLEIDSNIVKVGSSV